MNYANKKYAQILQMNNKYYAKRIRQEKPQYESKDFKTHNWYYKMK